MNSKGRFYPYVIVICIIIYITTQFLAIGSASSVGLMLREVSQKQETIFNFLISQSIEGGLRTATSPNITEALNGYKDIVLRVVSFNKNIRVYDITVFDLDGNRVTGNLEGIDSFSSLFGKTKPTSVIEPIVANIRYSNVYEDTVMDILIPIFENGRLTGVMWQTESFERINSAMKNVSILKTGESYIINKNGQVITDLKGANIREGSVTIKEDKILHSNNSAFEKTPYLDYKDEYVYGYHTNLNLNGWKLVTEVTEEEVTATTGNINSFMTRTVALILAASKLLEPVFVKYKKNRENEISNLDEIGDSSRYMLLSDKLLYEMRMIIRRMLKRYRRNSSIINLTVMVLVMSTSIIGISSMKTNHDIQNNLNSSSLVNKRLISYFINELKGQFYLNTRLISEFDTVDLEPSLERAVMLNQNFLNIVVLDEGHRELINITSDKIDKKNAIEALNQNSTFYNSIGVSEIFYDSNYNQYVFYLSSRVMDSQTGEEKFVICVSSFSNLSDMLLSNEIYSSRIITLLSKDKIMYSNLYQDQRLDNNTYDYLKTIVDKSEGVNDTIFNVNKYKNINKETVYGSYSNINNSDVQVYGSYVNINDTEWQLLYEEPEKTAKRRVKEVFMNLLIDVAYDYIQSIIKAI